MADGNPPVRTAPSSTDWDGNTVAYWTMTPSSITDPVHVVIPDPADCIPLYPLRYGLSAEGCSLAPIASRTVDGYPAPPRERAWGLRLLRPQSFVYLMYREGGEFKAIPYQVTSDARFAPVLDGKADAEDEANAIPYLPAPKTDVADTVYLMATDTILTSETVDKLSGTVDSLVGEIVTQVMPAETAQGQPDVGLVKGALDDGKVVPEMESRSYRGKGLDLGWSESLHDAPRGTRAVATLERISLKLNAGKGRGDPLAPVLHDPVGVMSEMSAQLGAHLDELGTYASDAARKLRVRQMIIGLGEQKYAQEAAEARNRANDINVRANYTVDTEAYVERQASQARAARFETYRQADADAFYNAHPGKLEALTASVRQAADELWSAWQGLEARYRRVIDLHDDTDTQNFLDLRLIVANTLLGLANSDAGEAWLKGQLGEEGPNQGTIMYRVLMGHPALQRYVEQSLQSAQQRFSEDITQMDDLSGVHGRVIDVPDSQTSLAVSGLDSMAVTTALKELQTVISKLPVDAASSKIAQVTAILLDSGKVKNSYAFLTSRFYAMLSAAEGSVLRQGKVSSREIGSWALKESNGTISKGFRPKTIRATQREAAEVVARYEADVGELAGKLRFWHNAKTGLGVLGILASGYTFKNALEALGEDDGVTLANSLNFGNAALLAGAGAYTLKSARFERLRDSAKLVGETSNAKALDGLANRYNHYAVGLTALAALMQAVNDLGQMKSEKDNERLLSGVGAGLQFTAAGVGVLHLLGKAQDGLIVEVIKEGGASMMSRSALAGASNRALTSGAWRLGGMAASGLARSAAFMAVGPVGTILFAIQALYWAIDSWHDAMVEEQKFTDWIARSVWGTGQRPDGWFSDGSMLTPYDDDQRQELRDYSKLWQQPTVSTDREWLRILAAGQPAGPNGQVIPMPETARSVSVLLPGWKPQVSWYEITQMKGISWISERQEKVVRGRDNVTEEDGYGLFTLESPTVTGTTYVKYYPNIEADPAFYLTVEGEAGAPDSDEANDERE